jgi:hypothetical protein
MTTGDPIALTINSHQSIQPIGNNYIFAKKGNIPCSGRVYSYIPSLTFDSQQVLHRTKDTMPLATSCRLIKEQQVLDNPYRLSPLHHSPYKMFIYTHSLATLPPFLPHPPCQCMCAAPLSPLRGIPGHSTRSSLLRLL